MFKVVSEITGAESIAQGRGLRDRARLVKFYGRAKWRKRRGFADITLDNGETLRAELHWYEATGVGKKEMKIKRLLPERK